MTEILLNPQHLVIAEHILKHKGTFSTPKIATETDMRQKVVRTLIHNLEDEGLVERVPDSGRPVFYKLNEACRYILETRVTATRQRRKAPKK